MQFAWSDHSNRGGQTSEIWVVRSGEIQQFRTNFEIRQDQMAFACGLSQANLSAIENDRREVGPRVALKLSAYMGLSPDIILYPNGYDNQPEFLEVKKRIKKIEEMAGFLTHRTSRIT